MAKTGSHICKNCGNEFIGWSGNPNKYCKKKCHDEAQQKHELLDCYNCGKKLSRKQTGHFIRQKRYYKDKNPNKYKQPYCSHSCLSVSQKDKKRKNCGRCGKFFWHIPSKENQGRGRYCSKKCHYLSNRINDTLPDSVLSTGKTRIKYLTDSYLRTLVHNQTGLKYSGIPKDFLSLKRAHLQLKRTIKEVKQ